ncbi:MAG: YfiR family protein [Magnetococcales bacterium]|nr:YfiR family protein [Magnetococcales bacterium]
MVYTLITALFILVLPNTNQSLAASRLSSKKQALEYQIKAVYLYNFIRFIKISNTQSNQLSSSIKICILGKDPFKSAAELIEAKKLQGRSLQVSKIPSGGTIDGCHVVFFSKSERNHIDDLLSAIKHTGILTVGDMPQFAKRGGIIGFVIKNKKVRLEINIDAAKREGLKISANLLEVATIIHKGGE